LYVGIHDVESGALSAGALSSFLFYALLAAVTAGSFSENYADFKRASGAADRLIDVMQIRPSAKPLPQKAKGATHLPARGTLAVHNINFSYPSFSNKEGQPELTLKRVAFSINPGESVAIVGPSGAGKTTLFSLLMRFYDPQQGSLYLDGIDYKDLTVEEVRKRIAMVPQDPALFSTTLIENITYGSPFASKAAITKAIEIARLEEVIEKLPKGMRTTVGPRGAHLSGGQRQRVAIARAILRDPVLLLLDEATSALDALNEEAIQKGLEYLTSTRSSLTIAHRLKTVLHSEKIIVLDKGMVTGVGSHADLCDSNPLYRKLATLQFFEPALDKGLGKGLGRGMDKGINRGLANS
jgi:ATP-binding cassette subfamily B protein